MSISYKMPVFFSDFSCLGEDCEDSCCKNWDVRLDRTHYELLKNAMVEKNEKVKFDKYIFLNNKAVTGEHEYAFIRLLDNGDCSMLEKSGLCSIQKNYDLSVLGDVCTMFPRVVSRCAETIELSSSLSCPEVVRLCIRDETPLKLNRFKPANLPRNKDYPIQRELPINEDDYYAQGFIDVRKKLMKVMANETLDFETRLYVVVNMANKLSSFYHRNCPKPDEGQLGKALTDLSAPEFIQKLDKVIKNHEIDSPMAMIVFHSIFSIKLQQEKNENISHIFQDILNGLDLGENNTAEKLSLKLLEAKNELDSGMLNYLDKALTRYLLNCLYREWFISMPDPFTYMQMLLVRTGLLRTLLYLTVFSNNKISKTKAGKEELEKQTVYVIYNFARNIDQNLEFLKIIYNALSEQSMITFDFSPVFIKLV